MDKETMLVWISTIEEEATRMTPIRKYLENGTIPSDHNESRTAKKQAAIYFLSQGRLFRRSFSGPYLWCITLGILRWYLKIYMNENVAPILAVTA